MLFHVLGELVRVDEAALLADGADLLLGAGSGGRRSCDHGIPVSVGGVDVGPFSLGLGGNRAEDVRVVPVDVLLESEGGRIPRATNWARQLRGDRKKYIFRLSLTAPTFDVLAASNSVVSFPFSDDPDGLNSAGLVRSKWRRLTCSSILADVASLWEHIGHSMEADASIAGVTLSVRRERRLRGENGGASGAAAGPELPKAFFWMAPPFLIGLELELSAAAEAEATAAVAADGTAAMEAMLLFSIIDEPVSEDDISVLVDIGDTFELEVETAAQRDSGATGAEAAETLASTSVLSGAMGLLSTPLVSPSFAPASSSQMLEYSSPRNSSSSRKSFASFSGETYSRWTAFTWSAISSGVMSARSQKGQREPPLRTCSDST